MNIFSKTFGFFQLSHSRGDGSQSVLGLLISELKNIKTSSQLQSEETLLGCNRAGCVSAGSTVKVAAAGENLRGNHMNAEEQEVMGRAGGGVL